MVEFTEGHSIITDFKDGPWQEHFWAALVVNFRAQRHIKHHQQCTSLMHENVVIWRKWTHVYKICDVIIMEMVLLSAWVMWAVDGKQEINLEWLKYLQYRLLKQYALSAMYVKDKRWQWAVVYVVFMLADQLSYRREAWSDLDWCVVAVVYNGLVIGHHLKKQAV